MKWPLLGIITVILLQTGFTAYNALYRPIESLFAVNELARGTNPVANTGDDYDAPDSGIYRKNSVNFNRVLSPANRHIRVRPTVALDSGSAKPHWKSATKRIPATQLVAMQKPFETVTITYPRPMQTSREIEVYSSQAVRFSEDKSFLSKSASAIKKPFKWVKAFGTKLL